MEKSKKKMKRRKPAVFAIFCVLFLVIGILFDVITPKYASVLAVAFSSSNVDEESHGEALETGYALNVELEEEGAVLLRNEDAVLPIATSGDDPVKLNVFGLRSAHLVLNSAGSASGSNAEAVDLKTSLEEAGFEVNADLWELLEGTSVVDNTSVNEGGNSAAIVELGVSEYTGDCSFETAKAYSDYAVVTFSRLGGEGADQDRTGLGDDGTQSYLELSSEEKELLETLESYDFKTIVLINSSYAMELGALEEYDVDAALWIGGPGVKGATAIGEILSGAVNPSGRLVDTYAYDLTTASTFVTSDNYAVLDENGEQIGGYTDYTEGIYYGYRWYETADAEGFWESDFAEDTWGVTGYEEVVQYPFGYGLSYTSFTQEFAKEPEYDEAAGELTFTVTVKNAGDTAGKEVVQLYAETPYTDGGVEMSKVTLAAYAKTALLEAGASEEVTLSLSVEDLASYDMTADDGNGAYVLAGGDYRFYLADGTTGAHCWNAPADEAEVAIEETVYAGDNKRSGDVIAASNQLTESATRNGEEIGILSRSGGFANAEETVFTEKEDLIVAEGEPLYEALVTNLSKAGDFQAELLEDLSTGQSGDLTLDDMIDTAAGYSDYEDERWDALLAQMSVDDLITLTGTGGWSTAAIESIGKEATEDIDGPFGLSNLIKNSMGNDVSCVSYCTEVVMASTWNTELVGRVGEAVAAEAEATNTSGWYAPGANTHRTPFGGRNPEYYSEDPYLSGTMCASEVNGALSRGLYVYIKHFAFNDTEANRVSKQNCYLDEQTAREIYLKPFEIAIKNGSYDEDGNPVTYGATGLMASYMWFEEQWGGGNYSLMTSVLRDEWGFNGMVITDNAAIVLDWITLKKVLYGGSDLMLVYNTAKLPESVYTSDEGVSALKTSAKHILWTIADAASRRGVQVSAGTNMWNMIYIAVNVVVFALALLMAVLAVVSVWKNKRPKMQIE